MKRNHTQTFTRDGGTQVICSTDANGRRLPTRYVRPDGTEAKAAEPAKKPPRRIEAKRTGAPARQPKRQCKHLGERKPQTLKVLCETCQGVNNIDQPVNACAVYGRCLPHFAPRGEAADRWYGNEAKGIPPRDEAAMYHVCSGCPSRELVEIALPTAPSPG